MSATSILALWPANFSGDLKEVEGGLVRLVLPLARWVVREQLYRLGFAGESFRENVPCAEVRNVDV